MIRPRHHGHSLAAGALLGLVFVSDHLLWTLTAAFLCGLVVGRGWGALSRLLHWTARGASPLTLRQWKAMRRRVQVLRPDDRVPF